MTNFKGYDDFIELLKSLKFVPFEPGHSASNGYELIVKDSPKRRACFYDNRLWGKSEIEFKVMDYGDEIIKTPFLVFFEKSKRQTRFNIYSKEFDIKELNKIKILELVEVSKQIA
jgi:hypothetical protein